MSSHLSACLAKLSQIFQRILIQTFYAVWFPVLWVQGGTTWFLGSDVSEMDLNV